ncbi:hypothetical protein NLG97_g3654 [Lecanicillium saksenae]|uniref:Uncharacterized protein n=1 Tax=Lecanicillium saksenae TaxID=468837 RepID=A0ACC1QZ95_9HYPO|nr:hypothetical protein NLG97_g3654 [Lecanicillium saksenae]
MPRIVDPSLSSRIPLASAPKPREYQDDETKVERVYLGVLGQLPFEVLQQLLLDCDIRSLFNLQLVSRDMKRAVHTLHEFHELVRLVPDTIRILAASKADTFVVCCDLYGAMMRPDCELCDRAGEYLYVLACHRLCRECLVSHPRYRPLRPNQATKQFRLKQRTLLDGQLPCLIVPKYSAAGCNVRYCDGERPINTTGWKLFDRECLLRRSLAEHGYSREEHDDWLLGKQAGVHDNPDLAHLYKEPDAVTAFSASVLFPWCDARTGTFGNIRVCRACHDSTSDEAGGITPTSRTQRM